MMVRTKNGERIEERIGKIEEEMVKKRLAGRKIGRKTIKTTTKNSKIKRTNETASRIAVPPVTRSL